MYDVPTYMRFMGMHVCACVCVHGFLDACVYAVYILHECICVCGVCIMYVYVFLVCVPMCVLDVYVFKHVCVMYAQPIYLHTKDRE